MTQLYNRNLLSGISSEKIQAVLDEAIAWLDEAGHELSDDVTAAIKDRLAFRQAFLSALDLDVNVTENRETQSMRESLYRIELIAKSTALGKPVERAFSLKIQRRLASTVPPRPMVNIKFEDAVQHMTRFCQDMIDVQDILDYSGTHNLWVSVIIGNIHDLPLTNVHRTQYGSYSPESRSPLCISDLCVRGFSFMTRECLVPCRLSIFCLMTLPAWCCHSARYSIP